MTIKSKIMELKNQVETFNRLVKVMVKGTAATILTITTTMMVGPSKVTATQLQELAQPKMIAVKDPPTNTMMVSKLSQSPLTQNLKLDMKMTKMRKRSISVDLTRSQPTIDLLQFTGLEQPKTPFPLDRSLKVLSFRFKLLENSKVSNIQGSKSKIQNLLVLWFQRKALDNKSTWFQTSICLKLFHLTR